MISRLAQFIGSSLSVLVVVGWILFVTELILGEKGMVIAIIVSLAWFSFSKSKGSILQKGLRSLTRQGRIFFMVPREEDTN